MKEIEVKRDLYLQKLIRKMNNGAIKIITRMRRVRKTYLLFTLFYNYLISIGIEKSNILRISFEDYDNRHLSNEKNFIKR